MESQGKTECNFAYRARRHRVAMRILFAVVLSLAVSDFASAGLFAPDSLSEKDAASIHKIAVVSNLGNTLHLDKIGLTVFQNKVEQVSVPDWNMDDHVLTYALDGLRSDGRFSFQVLNLPPGTELMDLNGPRPALRPAGRRQLIDQGRSQGVDAVLLIEVAGSPNAPTISPGFGLYDQHTLGIEHVSICTSIALALFRVDGNKVLALQTPVPLTQVTMVWPIRTSWEDLEPMAKRNIQDAIVQTLYARVESSLRAMKFAFDAPNKISAIKDTRRYEVEAVP